MDRTWYIYALVDPRTDDVRYVGVTFNPKTRYSDHLSHRKQREIYKYHWICSLRKVGAMPRMLILETGTGQSGRVEAERWWIAHLRKQGERLTNLTDGGEGTTGYNPPAETRQRMGDARRGSKASEETRRRLSASQIGRIHSPESIAKFKATRNLHPFTHSEETRKRISESVTGFRHTEETKQRIGAASLGHRLSPESIAKISAKHKGKVLTPGHRAKLSAAKQGRTLPEAQKESLRTALTGKPQRCGLCNAVGHNRRTCPERAQ